MYAGPPPKIHRTPAGRPPGARTVKPPQRYAIVGDFTPEGYDPDKPFRRIPLDVALPAA